MTCDADSAPFALYIRYNAFVSPCFRLNAAISPLIFYIGESCVEVLIGLPFFDPNTGVSVLVFWVGVLSRGGACPQKNKKLARERRAKNGRESKRNDRRDYCSCLLGCQKESVSDGISHQKQQTGRLKRARRVSAAPKIFLLLRPFASINKKSLVAGVVLPLSPDSPLNSPFSCTLGTSRLIQSSLGRIDPQSLASREQSPRHR